MRLYIGGICQGQAELAREENPGAPLFEGFHETIWRAVQGGEDARAFAARFCDAHPDAVLVADEVGSGVVPIAPGERAYREAVGRGLCVCAQRAQTVTRAVCGIGVRIK